MRHHFGRSDCFDRDLVLSWFMYHMRWEQRRELMRELPGPYNRLYGDDDTCAVFRAIDLDKDTLGKAL